MSSYSENPAWEHPLVGRRIGFLGKEGVGRTTLGVLLARALAARGYKVCLVDADSMGEGPSRALGLAAPPQSLLKHLRQEASGGSPPSALERSVSGMPTISLAELPQDVAPQPEEGIALLSLGKLGDCDEGEECDDPVTMLARDLRIGVRQEKLLTLLELDAGPRGSPSDLLARLDWVLVVVDPTFESVQVAGEVRERWQASRGHQAVAEAEVPSIPGFEDPERSRLRGILAVLNHMPDPETEQYFATAVSTQALLEPIGALREDWDVSVAGEKGRPLPEHKADARIEKIIDRLEEAERELLTETMT